MTRRQDRFLASVRSRLPGCGHTVLAHVPCEAAGPHLPQHVARDPRAVPQLTPLQRLAGGVYTHRTCEAG